MKPRITFPAIKLNIFIPNGVIVYFSNVTLACSAATLAWVKGSNPNIVFYNNNSF